MKELVIEARRDNLLTVQSFIEEQLEAYDCPVATLTTISIAVEELFVNIANYAYAPEVGNAVIQVAVHGDPPAAEIRFIDFGVPYNPLETPAPDTTLALNQRKRAVWASIWSKTVWTISSMPIKTAKTFSPLKRKFIENSNLCHRKGG